jgi:hypothetical protein
MPKRLGYAAQLVEQCVGQFECQSRKQELVAA